MCVFFYGESKQDMVDYVEIEHIGIGEFRIKKNVKNNRLFGFIFVLIEKEFNSLFQQFIVTLIQLYR